MPYIHEDARQNLHDHYLSSLGEACYTPGELNYVITTICDSYLGANIISYTRCNEIIGALECAKQEFYRRLVASYEDKKMLENGDVYRTRI
jgi:hypothetical protein